MVAYNENNQSDQNLKFNTQAALPMLLEYRKYIWLSHCEYILKDFLIPWAQTKLNQTKDKYEQIIVLIENRIDKQWLFTVLNTILMCPENTGICFITDSKNEGLAKSILINHNIDLKAIWYQIDSIEPAINLENNTSFNRFMKSSNFWEILPYENILIIQTDALLSEPLPKYFFDVGYLGAPFLPRVRSEYFSNRSQVNGEITNFFKVDTPFNCSPNKDIYPHFYGNGGLSIRRRSLMSEICKKYGRLSPDNEQEDVFFSRHLNEFLTPVPVHIAKAFAFETIYYKSSIGSHAAWKYLSTDELADYCDKHLREVWALMNE